MTSPGPFIEAGQIKTSFHLPDFLRLILYNLAMFPLHFIVSWFLLQVLSAGIRELGVGHGQH